MFKITNNMSNSTTSGSASDMIVDPMVANVMNCALCALMSFGLIMTPQKFMQGGRVQEAWFREESIPNERDDRLYYVAQFMGLLMLGAVVVPTFLYPSSQLLCYQMAVLHGVQLLHTCVFMLTSAYGDAKPTSHAGIAQWVFMMCLTLGFFVVSVLGGLHDVPDTPDPGNTVLAKQGVNIAALSFSSVFGILFVLAPRYLLSTFWQDEDQQDGDDFMGFKLLEMPDLDSWWTRCVGFSILGLNAGLLVEGNFSDPTYTTGTLAVFSLLTLHTLHQVMMRPYKSISDYQLKMSWIPNLIMSSAMIAVMVCAVVVQ